MKIRSILFICTGNSCRSVMAEGLMRAALKAAGRTDIEVTSAGIAAIDGFPPSEETIDVMRAEGIDVSHHRSRLLTPDRIADADLILVMEERHKDAVIAIDPRARGKTFLLKEYKAEKAQHYPENRNIPDPIGRPLDYYKLSLQLIKEQVERIARSI